MPIIAEDTRHTDCASCAVGVQFQTLFSRMSEGFAFGYVDIGNASPGVELRFLQVNAAFKRQLGMGDDALDKAVTKSTGGFNPLLIDVCYNVAVTGQEVSFESHSATTGRYHEFLCYSPRYGHFVALSRDVTERRQAEEALRQRVEELQRILDVLPAAVLIAEDPHCEVITGNALANRFVGVAAGTNLSQTAAGEAAAPPLQFFGPDGTQYLPADLPMQRAAATGQPVRDVELRIGLPGGRTACFAGNAAPLFRLDGKTIRGVVGAFIDISDRKRAEEELDRYREKLEQLVQARTCELRSLYARLESIREDEKARIAREIHDELGSTLALINLHATRLMGSLSQDPVLHPIALEVVQGLHHALGAARRIQTELHPPVLDDLGLPAAVKWQVEDFARRTRIEPVLRIDSDCRLPKTHEIALFRILQESLANVARHAKATRVSVELKRFGRSIWLSVADNGSGIPKQRSDAVSGGYGIRGMRERIRQIGAEITITSRPTGTCVMVEVPLTAEAPRGS